MLPSAQRVAIIWGSGFPENVSMAKVIETSAQARKLSVFSRAVSELRDLSSAFDEASAFGAAALVFLTDNLMFGHRKEVAALALSHHLPSIHAFSPEVADGGLLSYGAELEEGYQRAAALADRILRGSSPADLPVEEPTRFDFAVNLKTANALGLTIPPGVLANANEVTE